MAAEGVMTCDYLRQAPGVLIAEPGRGAKGMTVLGVARRPRANGS